MVLDAISGVNLTNLNASVLASGTVPAARFPAFTGDVTTVAGAVATTIAADAVTSAKILNDEIVNADIKTTAAIDRTKLANGTNNHVLINTAGGVMSSEAQLAISRGGTGLGSYTNNALIMANGTGTALTNATCATGEILMWNVTTWACTSMASSAQGYFKDGGNTFTGTATIGTNSNHNLEIETNGTTKMTVLADGKVGIGITNPAFPLDVGTGQVNAGSYSSGPMGLTATGVGQNNFYLRGIASGSNPAVTIGSSSGGVGGYVNLWDVAGTQTTRIAGSGDSYFTGGNVGIGTTTPAGTLDVQGGTATSGNGTPINIISQNAAAGNQNGGAINITAGNATGTGTGGAITITAGLLGNTGGTALFKGGTGFVNGGDAQMYGGNGATGNGGHAIVGGGTATVNGLGGNAWLVAGQGGSTSGNGGQTNVYGGGGWGSGHGGKVDIAGGTAAGTNKNGGNVVITGGTATGSGTTGNIQLIGNVGVGTTSPSQKLEVVGNAKISGQLATGSQTIVGGTSSLNWNNGNSISTDYNCGGTISFANLIDGGTYTLVVTDTGTTQCDFSTTTTGTGAGTVSYRFRPNNNLRTATSHTIYTLMRIGTIVYVSWASGF